MRGAGYEFQFVDDDVVDHDVSYTGTASFTTATVDDLYATKAYIDSGTLLNTNFSGSTQFTGSSKFSGNEFNAYMQNVSKCTR